MNLVPVAVVELPQFVRQASAIWSDDEREEFIDFIAREPEAVVLVPGTGGVRVVYFFCGVNIPLFLLMIYAKSVQEDLNSDAKLALAQFAAQIKQISRRR